MAQGYALVLRKMVEDLPQRAGERWRAVNAAAPAVARARPGRAPLRLLFGKVAGACCMAATWGTFRLNVERWPAAYDLDRRWLKDRAVARSVRTRAAGIA